MAKRHDCPKGVHEQITIGRYTFYRNDYNGCYLEVDGVRENKELDVDPIHTKEIEKLLDVYFAARWSRR